MPLHGQTGPGGGGACASSIPSNFSLRSKRRGRMERALSYSRPLNYSRNGRLSYPRPGSISYDTLVSWQPSARDRAKIVLPSKSFAEPPAVDRAPRPPPCSRRLGWPPARPCIFRGRQRMRGRAPSST